MIKYFLLIFLIVLSITVQSAAVSITSYNILNARTSGYGGWGHTYNGTITSLGGTLANYSGGGGTLNNGTIETNASTTQLFDTTVSPSITLFLSQSVRVDQIELYNYNDGNGIPGCLTSFTVTINGVSVNYSTVGFGSVNGANGGVNERVTLNSSQNTLTTSQITLSSFVSASSYPTYFSTNEIVVNGTTASSVPNISSNNVNFGNVRVGTSSAGTLTVTNTGDSGSTLTGTINPASGDFSPTSGTQNFSLASGTSASRTFTYTPSSRGADSYNVSITSNAQNVSSNLSGTGVSPVYQSSLSPGSTMDFGTVDKDVTITKTLTIQNITPDADLGNLTNLTLLSATISGADASFFTLSNFTPGTVLSKNALTNLLITVTNSDYLVRNKYATLTIVTDENAALGIAGNTYTYQLTAYTVPEASTFLFLSLTGLLWGIARIFHKTR